MKKPDQERDCQTHGRTAFVHEPSKSGTGYRCRKCRTEAVTAKRRRLKIELVDQLGGACTRCGYSRCVEALHFHHVDGKDGAVSTMIGAYRSRAAREEVRRCVLLCANCHAEEHSQTMHPVGIEPTSSGLQPDA